MVRLVHDSGYLKLASIKETILLTCTTAWVGVRYCFGGGATRRVGIQVNLKSCLPQFLGILNSPQPGLAGFLIG